MKKFLLIAYLILEGHFIVAQPIRYFSSDRDLSSSMITKIIQDSRGFMWIATEDGLNRFDGLRFTKYRNIPNDSTTLLSNFVRTLFFDSRRRLWVGCINGLMLYDDDKESFQEVMLFRDTMRLRPHVTSIIESANGDILVGTSGQGVAVIKQGLKTGYTDLTLSRKLSSEFLECLFEDYKGRLWIGTENEGLNLFNPATNSVTVFRHQPETSSSLSSNYITVICEDDRRNILIGTLNAGINLYDENDRSFRLLPIVEGFKTSLPVRSIYTDRKFNIWVGTDGLGLWSFNTSSRQLEPKNVSLSRFNVNKAKVHTITEDHEGNMWMGVFHKGVVLIPGKPNRFNTITYQQFGQKDLGSGCITAISESTNGNIWIGTDTDGIYNYNLITGKITRHLAELTSGSVFSNSITSIYSDRSDNLWVGTSLEGFFRLSAKTNAVKHYKHKLLDKNSLSNDKVQCITMDKKGDLWIGTSGGGLNRYNPSTGRFCCYLNDAQQPEKSICNNWINVVFCDSDGLIWIGTYNRLSIYDPVKNSFKMLSTANGKLPNNIVYHITEDTDKKIWIGTNEGLVCYDKHLDKSTFYTTTQGLSNNVVCAILEDSDKQLWISTHLGISCLSLTDSTFQNYYVHDGLQANEFRRNSALKSQQGDLFFGGINGITWFAPETILRDHHLPEVYLTNLVLYNKEVQIGETIDNRKLLKKILDQTDTLFLAWHQKNFSIEFSTIGFNNPERIAYQYRLNGFEKNWNTTGVLNRRATYTNLEPGKYTFEIRATDKGMYSQPRQLTIIIRSPWWSSTWFKALYTLAFLLVLYLVYMYLRGRIRHRTELFKLEQHEKINEAKLQFFTNISHEIRTPLTLIAGPLEKLIMDNKDPKLSRTYNLMQRNLGRLLRLVNQMLDVRKLDQGTMIINYSKTDLIRFVTDIMQSFNYLAEKKNISYTCESATGELPVWIDPDNFDKVIYNVLSNAFKFTPENGEIRIEITKEVIAGEPEKKFAAITVTDSGPGIPEYDLEQIFERFYKIENDQTNNPGTGIGLHLSRSLIELQGGKIYAENRKDRSGSVFHILIPLVKHHVIPNSQIVERKVELSMITDFTGTAEKTPSLVDPESVEHKGPKPQRRSGGTILIADDDLSMQDYLYDELKEYFNIVVCSNGREALECVLQHKPDLIITDIMMPVMDGMSLCKKLKSNPNTRHLPVLLLTAMSRDEDKIASLEIGADAYMVKPFNSQLLRKNIDNLLNNRERIRITYSAGGNLNAADSAYSSADSKLMDKVMMVIENHLADPKLNAEFLSFEVGMSRVHLYRRMKKITGQSPSDFIKKIRLQRAAYLLRGQAGFIKEIAYETGFVSLSHFSRCFHDYYGINPSDYQKKAQQGVLAEV